MICAHRMWIDQNFFFAIAFRGVRKSRKVPDPRCAARRNKLRCAPSAIPYDSTFDQFRDSLHDCRAARHGIEDGVRAAILRVNPRARFGAGSGPRASDTDRPPARRGYLRPRHPCASPVDTSPPRFHAGQNSSWVSRPSPKVARTAAKYLSLAVRDSRSPTKNGAPVAFDSYLSSFWPAAPRPALCDWCRHLARRIEERQLAQ